MLHAEPEALRQEEHESHLECHRLQQTRPDSHLTRLFRIQEV